MAGAMRKMAVYLGLVEDDGYDGRGFDPDDDFEPELDPEPERDRRRHEPSHQSHQAHQPQRDESVRMVQPPAQREPASQPASLPAESGRPARIAPVASITQERQSMEKNAPVIMPKVVSEREPYRIRSEEHTSELQSQFHLVCRLLLEKKKKKKKTNK